MAANSETEINLKTLQRVDSNIVEIIDTASQVAIYKYETKLEKWEGTDIEGTLFLYRRSRFPYHGFIIVNRMSTTNFIESITSDMQFQLQEPYLLYKNHSGDIIGSWFYEDRDLRRITTKIQTIVLTQVSPPRRQRCASESETQPKKDVKNVMTLLSQAHEEYVKKISLKKNVKENIPGNVDTHLKNDQNKKMNSSEAESKTSGACFSQENPISPRRRFLSADSSDRHLVSSISSALKETINENSSSHSKPILLPTSESKNHTSSKNMSSEFIAEYSSTPSKYIACSNFTSEGFSAFPHKCEDSSAPTRLSPLFSRDEILSPSFSDIGILEESFGPHDLQACISPKSKITNSSSQNTEKKFSLGNGTAVSHPEYDQHSSAIKQALFSHFEANSDAVLKIHDAYVSSLKSLFIK